MIHAINGTVCSQITRVTPLTDEAGTVLHEVRCLHGFTWFAGPPVAQRGWQPRTDPETRPCTRCGEDTANARYCDNCRTTCSACGMRPRKQVGARRSSWCATCERDQKVHRLEHRSARRRMRELVVA